MSTVAENARKRSRAAAACEFCRKRKLKCDNTTPRCQHCESRNKDCVYTGQAKKPRPSNARIALLEEENERLRKSLSGLELQVQPETEVSNTSKTSLQRSTRSERLVENCPCPEVQSSSQTSSRPHDNLLFLPDKESRYHGPTSALFDEAALQSDQPQQVAAIQDENQIKVKNQLLAETVRQRQLEAINFTAGKLDFDIEDPELGMHLLSIYWNRQIHFGLIVYQTVFMRDMACAGPYFSKLLLNAIFFSASKNTLRTEVRRDPGNIRTAGYKYRQRFMELLSAEFDKSKITTIQALIIVAGALFTWCDERSTSFLYAGMSFNMIVDLGLHVSICSRKIKEISEEDLEVRRRLYWGAYVFDKIHAVYQGRPASLRTTETDVPMEFLDDYEELEQFRPLSYTDGTSSIASPTHTITAFKEICKLSIISDKVLNSFYAQQSPKRNPADLLVELKSLYAELEDWRNMLPRHLEYKTVASLYRILLPHMISHISMFNAIVILLHRPFVSEGHLHTTTPSVAYDSFKICASAANEINFLLRAYRKDFLLSQAPYMISYATYVSATIHVRIAAQREHGSEAYAALQTCLDVLDEQTKVLLAPRKAKLIVHRLMKRMGVVIGSADVPLPSQPLSRTGMRLSSLGGLDPSTAPPSAVDLLQNAANDNLQSNSLYPTEKNDAVEPQVLDFDIDAILRSFPHEPEISATLNNSYTQSVQYNQPTTNPVVAATNTRATQFSTPSTSTMQDFGGLDATQTWDPNNIPIFSDPIFGLGDFWFDFDVDQE